MKISLGFSIGHDKGCAVVIDGEVKVAISQERISRIKHDMAFDPNPPVLAIDYCLGYLNLSYEDVDVWVYNKSEGDDRIDEIFETTFNVSSQKLKYIPHHLAHAYSSFYSSGFDESAVIVADAMGSTKLKGSKCLEWFGGDWDGGEGYDYAEGITIYHFKDGKDQEVFKKWIKYPIRDNPSEMTSVGEKYGKGTFQLVYHEETNTWNAGKLMGLASYADQEWVDGIEDDTILTEDDIFIPSSPFSPHINYRSDFYSKSNVAGLYQRGQEKNSLHLAKIAKKITGSNNICVSGGSFLNCNTNELILKSNLYDGNYFIPCADDSGIPLGCAWWGYKFIDSKLVPLNNILSPYTGKVYSQDEIEIDLRRFLSETNSEENLDIRHYSSKEDQIKDLASKISENMVVGFFQGGCELGPRALGNRSILASPKKEWIRDYINHEIKMREWYRPFAPSVLYENQSEVFDLDVFSPYMLVTARVKEEWKKKIPSVVHIDGTSRYQSVISEFNPDYYSLIKNFYEITGIPLVLNTSFNGPDEPIVETPYEALRTFWKRNLKSLYIGNYIISRR